MDSKNFYNKDCQRRAASRTPRVREMASFSERDEGDPFSFSSPESPQKEVTKRKSRKPKKFLKNTFTCEDIFESGLLDTTVETSFDTTVDNGNDFVVSQQNSPNASRGAAQNSAKPSTSCASASGHQHIQKTYTAKQALEEGLLDTTVETSLDTTIDNANSCTYAAPKPLPSTPKSSDVVPNSTPTSSQRQNSPNARMDAASKPLPSTPKSSDVPNSKPTSSQRQNSPTARMDSASKPLPSTPKSSDVVPNSTPTSSQRRRRKQQTPSKVHLSCEHSPPHSPSSSDSTVLLCLDNEEEIDNEEGIVPPTPPSRPPPSRRTLFQTPTHLRANRTPPIVSTPASSFHSLHFDSTQSSISLVYSDSEDDNYPAMGSDFSSSDGGFETDVTSSEEDNPAPDTPLLNHSNSVDVNADVSHHGQFVQEQPMPDCPLDQILPEDEQAGWEYITQDEGLAGADILTYRGGPPKLNIQPTEDTPLAYFKLFFPETFWEEMARETNIYARFTLGKYYKQKYFFSFFIYNMINVLLIT